MTRQRSQGIPRHSKPGPPIYPRWYKLPLFVALGSVMLAGGILLLFWGLGGLASQVTPVRHHVAAGVPAPLGTGQPHRFPTPIPQAGTKPAVTVYTVKQGDNLWDIAKHACGDGNDWHHLASASMVPNPNRIKAGERLKLEC